MDFDPISPELALVDPALASCETEEAFQMIDSLDPANGHATAVNGSSDRTVDSGPSIEALLFKSGVISADQLGELVRDSVLTQRPVAAIAVERGLATTETLAELIATAGTDGTTPTLPENGLAAGPATPELQVVAPEALPEVPLPRLAPPAPLASLDERVHAAVALAAQQQAPEPEPAVIAPPLPAVAPLPEIALAPEIPAVPEIALAPEIPAVPEIAAAPEIAVAPTAAPAAFAVLVRLQTGDRVAAQTAATFESAVDLARSLAGRFERAGEWPLVAGRCIRPEAVVSIDIERALES